MALMSSEIYSTPQMNLMVDLVDLISLVGVAALAGQQKTAEMACYRQLVLGVLVHHWVLQATAYLHLALMGGAATIHLVEVVVVWIHWKELLVDLFLYYLFVQEVAGALGFFLGVVEGGLGFFLGVVEGGLDFSLVLVARALKKSLALKTVRMNFQMAQEAARMNLQMASEAVVMNLQMAPEAVVMNLQEVVRA